MYEEQERKYSELLKISLRIRIVGSIHTPRRRNKCKVRHLSRFKDLLLSLDDYDFNIPRKRNNQIFQNSCRNVPFQQKNLYSFFFNAITNIFKNNSECKLYICAALFTRPQGPSMYRFKYPATQAKFSLDYR